MYKLIPESIDYSKGLITIGYSSDTLKPILFKEKLWVTGYNINILNKVKLIIEKYNFDALDIVVKEYSSANYKLLHQYNILWLSKGINNQFDIRTNIQDLEVNQGIYITDNNQEKGYFFYG